MSVFSSSIVKEYGGTPWEVTDTEKLEQEEIDAIQDITVVTKEQEWGESTSMCFLMKTGRVRFIPLSRDSELEEGDQVDPTSVVLLTLSREGDDDIVRADGAILEEKPKAKAKGKKKK